MKNKDESTGAKSLKARIGNIGHTPMKKAIPLMPLGLTLLFAGLLAV